MGVTSISWTDRSVNPIRARLNGHVGHHCEKLSAGCANCYSSRLQSRFKMPEFRADQRRGVEVFFDHGRLREVLTRRTPTKWFWCDMTDLFGDWVEEAWIDKVFAVCALTPQHTHQILTKRPERMRVYMDKLSRYPEGHCWEGALRGFRVFGPDLKAVDLPLRNVHLGVSVEDQATADQRIPLLLQTPAAVRWVSAEPLLAGVDFTDIVIGRGSSSEHHINVVSLEDDNVEDDEEYSGACLDWVVVGGESGPTARPCRVEWIHRIVEQCRETETACFVKQLGARPIWAGSSLTPVAPARGKCADPDEWPEALRVQQFPAVRS